MRAVWRSGDIPLFLPQLSSPLIVIVVLSACQWDVIVSFADETTAGLQGKLHSWYQTSQWVTENQSPSHSSPILILSFDKLRSPKICNIKIYPLFPRWSRWHSCGICCLYSFFTAKFHILKFTWNLSPLPQHSLTRSGLDTSIQDRHYSCWNIPPWAGGRLSRLHQRALPPPDSWVWTVGLPDLTFPHWAVLLKM